MRGKNRHIRCMSRTEYLFRTQVSVPLVNELWDASCIIFGCNSLSSLSRFLFIGSRSFNVKQNDWVKPSTTEYPTSKVKKWKSIAGKTKFEEQIQHNINQMKMCTRWAHKDTSKLSIVATTHVNCCVCVCVYPNIISGTRVAVRI